MSLGLVCSIKRYGDVLCSCLLIELLRLLNSLIFSFKLENNNNTVRMSKTEYLICSTHNKKLFAQVILLSLL